MKTAAWYIYMQPLVGDCQCWDSYFSIHEWVTVQNLGNASNQAAIPAKGRNP